jgi:hypothetical protein
MRGGCWLAFVAHTCVLPAPSPQQAPDLLLLLPPSATPDLGWHNPQQQIRSRKLPAIAEPTPDLTPPHTYTHPCATTAHVRGRTCVYVCVCVHRDASDNTARTHAQVLMRICMCRCAQGVRRPPHTQCSKQEQRPPQTHTAGVVWRGRGGGAAGVHRTAHATRTCARARASNSIQVVCCPPAVARAHPTRKTCAPQHSCLTCTPTMCSTSRTFEASEQYTHRHRRNTHTHQQHANEHGTA